MKKLQTVDAATLISTPLKPTLFIIEEILPQGLHLFCGSPKVGKSWCMLWLCLCVSKGEPLWQFPTAQSEVLYLCLEDSFARIQNRMFQLTDEVNEHLHFAILALDMENGLIDQLNFFVKEYPQTKLIVIDTLQKIRISGKDNNAYANDYKDISKLKAFADGLGIAVILVHHLRKLGDKDPFQKVSGTTGLTGAVDSTFILEKEINCGNAKLLLSGRDVESIVINLVFKDCKWFFESCEKSGDIIKKQVPKFVFQVVEFAKQVGFWKGNATKLLQDMNIANVSVNAVTKLLNQYHNIMLNENNIEYFFKRTGAERIISLKYNDACDGNDTFISKDKTVITVT